MDFFFNHKYDYNFIRFEPHPLGISIPFIRMNWKNFTGEKDPHFEFQVIRQKRMNLNKIDVMRERVLTKEESDQSDDKKSSGRWFHSPLMNCWISVFFCKV